MIFVLFTGSFVRAYTQALTLICEGVSPWGVAPEVRQLLPPNSATPSNGATSTVDTNPAPVVSGTGASEPVLS